MRYFLLLVFVFVGCPGLVLGQLRALPGVVSSKRVASAPAPGDGNIDNITIDDLLIPQYSGTAFTITPNTHGANVTHWRWRILKHSFDGSNPDDTVLHSTSSEQNPEITITKTENSVDNEVEFYTIKLTARNSTDKYQQEWSRRFQILPPRFPEDEADLVVDMSTGSKFWNYAGQDHSDFKIYVKGTSANAQLQFVDLHGTPGHPVIIQKSNDNVQVDFTFTNGNGKAFHFSTNSTLNAAGHGARYVIVNGWNLDGTQGIKVSIGASGTKCIAVEGKITDVGIYGVEVYANPLTISGAGIAMVPYVNSATQSSNWPMNNMHAYGCKGYAGEEMIYIGQSDQGADYVGNDPDGTPPYEGFPPPSGIGNIICRNICYGAGREPWQNGSGGVAIEDNWASDYGQQHENPHEACISFNNGAFGTVRRNYCQNGEMFISGLSGEYPWSPLAGQTTPQPIIIENNIYKYGAYSAGGTTEPYAIYWQTNPDGVGTGLNYNLTIRNNIVDTDHAGMEMYAWSNSFTTNLTFVNNVLIKVGSAGDFQDLNLDGPAQGTLIPSPVRNNITLNQSGDAAAITALQFTDRAAGNYEPTSTSSTMFGGSPTNTGAGFDYFGFPVPLPGAVYFFGPYSLFNKRTITP